MNRNNSLLEQAAKVVGISDYQMYCTEMRCAENSDMHLWNPLIDDGDALKLAVKQRVFTVYYAKWHHNYLMALNDDLRPPEATRRAIVETAVEIGEIEK